MGATESTAADTAAAAAAAATEDAAVASKAAAEAASEAAVAEAAASAANRQAADMFSAMELARWEDAMHRYDGGMALMFSDCLGRIRRVKTLLLQMQSVARTMPPGATRDALKAKVLRYRNRAGRLLMDINELDFVTTPDRYARDVVRERMDRMTEVEDQLASMRAKCAEFAKLKEEVTADHGAYP